MELLADSALRGGAMQGCAKNSLKTTISPEKKKFFGVYTKMV
jgi:hypothetical protein